MKRIAIGDIHLSEFKDDKIIDGLPRRLRDIQFVMNEICEYCNKNNIENIDILGDLYNDKNIIYTDSQNIFKNIIINNKNINFNIISGNHDLSSAGENQTSAIQAFEGYENVKCFVDKPSNLDGCTVLPFSNKMSEYFQKLEPNNILLSHFGVSEAMLQSGISIISNIKMVDLSKFKLVLIGHYHKPQNLQNKNTNVWYTGSLIHLDWRDKNEQKRFLVYDTETLEVESIPITGITEYKEFIVTDKNKDDVVSLLDLSKEEKEKGNIVRVIRKSKDLKEKDQDFSEQGIMIIDDTDVDITQRGINVDMTEDDRFNRYMEIKEIEENDKNEYLNIVKKIIGNEDIFVDDNYIDINIENDIIEEKSLRPIIQNEIIEKQSDDLNKKEDVENSKISMFEGDLELNL